MNIITSLKTLPVISLLALGITLTPATSMAAKEYKREHHSEYRDHGKHFKARRHSHRHDSHSREHRRHGHHKHHRHHYVDHGHGHHHREIITVHGHRPHHYLGLHNLRFMIGLHTGNFDLVIRE